MRKGTERRTLTLTRPKIPITDSNTTLIGMISIASLATVRDSIPAFNAAAASEWDLVLRGMFSTVQDSKVVVIQDGGRWGVGGTRERKRAVG